MNHNEISVKYVLERLSEEGVNVSSLAKELSGISEKKLRSALTKCGYEYRNSGKKGWVFIGEGEEPLNDSIYNYVEQNNTAKPSQKNVSKKVFTLPSHEVTQQLTDSEIIGIRKLLLQRHEENKDNALVDVYKKILDVPEGDKGRKTVIVNVGIWKRIEKFCNKGKYDKSDIFNVALIDFLNRHEE